MPRPAVGKLDTQETNGAVPVSRPGGSRPRKSQYLSEPEGREEPEGSHSSKAVQQEEVYVIQRSALLFY